MLDFLPPGVSCKKIPYGDTFFYEFSHRSLGSLGRMYLEPLDSGNCVLKSEIVNSHPNDPNSGERARLFKEVDENVSEVFDKLYGTKKVPDDYEFELREDNLELVHNKICQCEQCGVPIHILISYPSAASEIDFINVKRKMYGQIHQADLPTYVIGKENLLGNALIYQIWPIEKRLGHIAPEPFSLLSGSFCKSCLN